MRTLLLRILLLGVAATAFAEESAPVRIGVIAGLTGDYAAVFQNWVNGIVLASEMYAKQQKSPPVLLFVEDDQFKATAGLAAYRKLTDINHIQGLLNGTSVTVGAISPLVAKGDIPVLQLGEETAQPADDSIIQIMPGNVEMERQLGAYLQSRWPEGLVVFYTLNSTMLRFLEGLKQGYGKPMAAVELSPEDRDLRAAVLKALALKPACIAVLAFPSQGAALVKALWEGPGRQIPLAFDGNFQTGLIEYRTQLRDLARLKEATVAVFPKQVDVFFAAAYRERFKAEPGIMADLGFDAFNLLMKSYDPSGTKWIEKLKSSEFAGASGEIRFDSLGIRRPKVELITVGQLLQRE